MSKFLLAAAALVLLPAVAVAQEAPTAFNQCKACHKVEPGKNGVGPSLFGVFGAKAGTNAAGSGYKYSDAMINSGKTWDEATLTAYISNPKETVPGNKMAFAGLKNPEQVAAVVAYLKTLK